METWDYRAIRQAHSGVSPRAAEPACGTGVCSPAFIAAQVPGRRGAGREDVASAHNGISLHHEKEGSPAICDNMGGDLEGIVPSETSQRSTNTA